MAHLKAATVNSWALKAKVSRPKGFPTETGNANAALQGKRIGSEKMNLNDQGD